MAKTKNPYRQGSVYFMIFAFVQSLKRSFTKQEVVEYAQTLDTTLKQRMIKKRPNDYKGMKAGDTLKMSEAQAKASTDVVCGPTAENTGNASSQGHLYYMDPCTRKMVKNADGKKVKEKQRFLLRYRKEALESVKRETKKTATKKTATKKTAAKKVTVKSVKKATKKTAAKKTPAKKTATKKTPAKKTTAKRTAKRTRKPAAKKVAETPQVTAPAVAPAVNETAVTTPAATETA